MAITDIGSDVSLSDEAAEDDVREVLSNCIMVVDFLDHLDVELLLPLRKLGLEDHKEIVPVLVLETDALCKRRHLP